MAVPARLGRQVSSSILKKHGVNAATHDTKRLYATQALKRSTAAQSKLTHHTQWRQGRKFTSSPRPQTENKSQLAPTAQAYINSGVISGGQNLVDVKKVLVIGSGGLSIGQAGEFDYSGRVSPFLSGIDRARTPRGSTAIPQIRLVDY